MVTLLVAWLPMALAGDIGNDIRDAEPSPSSENGGFLELGLIATFGRGIEAQLVEGDDTEYELRINLHPSINAGYRYNRLFVEASDSGFDGLNLGATLFANKTWSVDLLLANIAGEITIESDEPPAPVTEEERNSALLERDSLFIAAGTRVTGYFGDNIVQLRLVSDWYDDNGIQGSARVGRQVQLGNWNLQGIIGARYYSPRFNNYLYGVSSEDQTNRFSEYRAGNAWIPEIELGASVPINKDWVFSSRLRMRRYPNSITDSPLVAENTDATLITGVHYVF